MLGEHRVAINPLQFAATPDGWFDFAAMPPQGAILDAVAGAGFTAVCASPLPGQAGSDYADDLAAAGLGVGPGYIAVEWDDERGGDELPAIQRAAERLAACGADLVFIGLEVHPGSRRFQRPAFGVAGADDRLLRVADHLADVGTALTAVGLTGALHPHVGSWVETESETRRVLDRSPGLAFGPDIGHLAWARADIGALLADYRSSVAGVHIKDHSRRVLLESLAAGRDYSSTVSSGLWTEPGYGDADIPAVVAALDDPTCWLVIEVDRAPDSDPVASIRRCAEWVRRQ